MRTGTSNLRTKKHDVVVGALPRVCPCTYAETKDKLTQRKMGRQWGDQRQALYSLLLT